MKTTDRLRALADAIERRDLGYSDLAGNTVALLRDASRELERGHDEQRFLTSSVVFAEACAVAVGVFAAQLVGWWAMLLVVPLIALSRKHWNRGGNRGAAADPIKQVAFWKLVALVQAEHPEWSKEQAVTFVRQARRGAVE